MIYMKITRNDAEKPNNIFQYRERFFGHDFDFLITNISVNIPIRLVITKPMINGNTLTQIPNTQNITTIDAQPIWVSFSGIAIK
jgi:hypothetical protein